MRKTFLIIGGVILFIIIIAIAGGGGEKKGAESEQQLPQGQVQSEQKFSFETYITGSRVREYEIVNEEDISIKALGNKRLSDYSSEELAELPNNFRMKYQIIVPSDITLEELKSTLAQVIKEKSAEKPSNVQPEKGEIVKETEQKGEIENTGKIENIKEEASYGTEEKTNLKEELLLDYQKAVKKKIENCRKYPKWARRQGFEGKVHLKFTILSTGEVRDIKILKSSGFNILDKEAISTIKRASPFPPIPSELKISSLTMEISIVFKLQY